jgi:hypothetical protein
VRQASLSEVVVVGPGAASVVETVVSPKEVALESLSYTASEVFGGKGWVEPRAQPCPKADEWCGRSATSPRNRIAKACHA